MSPLQFDATLNATEPCADDDLPQDADNAEPYCTICGACAGVFLKHGTDWRHFRSTAATAPELYDTDHAPVIAWRPAPAPTTPTTC